MECAPVGDCSSELGLDFSSLLSLLPSTYRLKVSAGVLETWL